MFDSDATIEGFDEEIWRAIQDESVRQEEHIELIASENYASPRILAAQGSGCDVMDHALTQIPYALIAAAISCVGLTVLAAF